jgi:hypothetical protein
VVADVHAGAEPVEVFKTRRPHGDPVEPEQVAAVVAGNLIEQPARGVPYTPPRREYDPAGVVERAQEHADDVAEHRDHAK